MTINYLQLVFIYSPVFLLLFIALLRDRKSASEKCSWSLSLPVAVIAFSLSHFIAQSFWGYIPLLEGFAYNQFNWDVFSLFWYAGLLLVVCFLIRHTCNVSLVEVFQLRLSHLRFILIICGILLVINLFTINVLGFNILLKPLESELESIRSLSVSQRALNLLIAIIVAPVVEESIYRGLLYGPLYRKIGRWPAIVLTSLIWTHGHFLPLFPSIGLFISGLVLSWLYARSGSLVHPLVLHVFKNNWLILAI